MESPSGRKKYNREFKLEAVRMSNQPGKTVAEVARELDLRENDLHAWRKMVAEQGNKVFPGQGRKNAKDNNELEQLRRENKRLREERDILKKSAIFFARESRTDTDS